MSSDYEADDPNAPTTTQCALKRIESAIRKRADSALLLDLDHICLISDTVKRSQELVALTQKLQRK